MIRGVAGFGFVLIWGMAVSAASSFAELGWQARAVQAQNKIIMDWGLMNPQSRGCFPYKDAQVACNISYEQRLCQEILDASDRPGQVCRCFTCLEQFIYDESSRQTFSNFSYGCE